MTNEDRIYTVKDIADYLKISQSAVKERAKERNIKPELRLLKNLKTAYYNKIEFGLISQDLRKENHPEMELPLSIQVRILRLFNLSEHNSTFRISHILDLPFTAVDRVVFDYINGNGFILLESKMNSRACQSGEKVGIV